MLSKQVRFKKTFPFILVVILFWVSRGVTLEIPGSTYTVQKGDTLWGIASSHYTDPFLWPKLWGKNPSIPHPDRIYPGEKIFLPSEAYLKELEKQVEPPAAVENIPEPPEIKEELGEMENEKVEEPPVPAEYQASEQPSIAPPWNPTELLTGGFILKEDGDMGRVGQIVASENEHTLLGEGDIVYVVPEKGHSFQIGQQETIYFPVKAVHHPKTRRLMGSLIQIKGIIEIIPNPMPGARKETFSARIIKSYTLIDLGDFLTSYHPADPIDLMVNQVPFPDKINGMIVGTRETKGENGQHDIVYLDKGSQDGIHPGHLLVVFKEGKKVPFYSPDGSEKLPQRIIGELEVILVQKDTATAIVGKSIEPLVVGDKISNPPSP